jgi:hypothetical protein
MSLICHTSQPAREAHPVDEFRTTCQDQECCLRCILGIVRSAHYAPTDIKDQPLIPPDQQLERRVVAVLNESLEEIRIVVPLVFGGIDAFNNQAISLTYVSRR